MQAKWPMAMGSFALASLCHRVKTSMHCFLQKCLALLRHAVDSPSLQEGAGRGRDRLGGTGGERGRGRQLDRVPAGDASGRGQSVAAVLVGRRPMLRTELVAAEPTCAACGLHFPAVRRGDARPVSAASRGTAGHAGGTHEVDTVAQAAHATDGLQQAVHVVRVHVGQTSSNQAIATLCRTQLALGLSENAKGKGKNTSKLK
ncbi:unnamed protein product [Protopolystoma xenopodis]|uniref:Uncharacterized protein n=1 Tax=Protopolystoma xenopodis TaxID=117903 RepID=A0A448XLJ9_9PLAT|nr:unnamed protein product [Protopolystoma xenopodis]